MGGGNTAALATDGITDPRGQCTRTSSGMNPWWRVRLEAIYTIISVAIFTPECCGKYKKRASVRVHFTMLVTAVFYLP